MSGSPPGPNSNGSMPMPPPMGGGGEPYPSQRIMYDLLMALVFPSVACFLFLFYNFVRSRQLRVKPANRFLIYLLIVSFIQVQKVHLKQQQRLGLWRKNMRMIDQLVSVAILYMGVFIPSCGLLLLTTFLPNNSEVTWAVAVRDQYFLHLKYLVIFLCPFVILAGQTAMHEQIKRLFRCISRPQNTNVILPMTIMPNNPTSYHTKKTLHKTVTHMNP